MKVVILAGGYGTRLAEETEVTPKPMIRIGGLPILWHIMKLYSSHGLNDFVVCLGYKGYVIKEFFANYFLHMSDVTLDLVENEITVHEKRVEPWRVTLVDTGEDSQTGGRLGRIRDHLDKESFCMTYGDGVGNVDISRLIEFHGEEGRDATVTAVRPPGRFGAIEIEGSRVSRFVEKPRGDGGWISGGFFVLEPCVLDLVEDDSTIWEREPLERLAAEKRLSVFKHDGFWQAMDTLRDKRRLETLWNGGEAPWKVWS